MDRMGNDGLVRDEEKENQSDKQYAAPDAGRFNSLIIAYIRTNVRDSVEEGWKIKKNIE